MTVRAIRMLQKMLLLASYEVFRLINRRKANPISWVIGTDEIAGMVFHIAQVVPQAHSVVLSTHEFYKYRYGTQSRTARSPRLDLLRRVVVGPVILARLLTLADGFLFVGSNGFLLADPDQRRFEFSFIRSKGARIACYFVGDDIRSPRLMHEAEERTQRPNISSHIAEVSPVFETQAYEDKKRMIAEVAEAYSDVIFTAPVDQLSYLSSHTEPVAYFYPDENFNHDKTKFDELSRPRVLHAPSSPALKGTRFVRSAIERLEADGYDFEYIELRAASNENVQFELRRAHIVLNQFYAFLPGVFGIEALAARCAVLMSADEHLEPILPAGSNQAWVVTGIDEIYQNLRTLLDEPGRIAAQADQGQKWAIENAAMSNTAAALRRTLDQVLNGDYQREGKAL